MFWRHKWPQSNEIDLAKYIQEADEIETYITQRELDVSFETKKGDQNRISLQFNTVDKGGDNNCVLQIDGAFVLFDTMN